MTLGTGFVWLSFPPARSRGKVAFPLALAVTWICKIILCLTDLISWVGIVKALREIVSKKKKIPQKTPSNKQKNAPKNLLKMFLRVKSKPHCVRYAELPPLAEYTNAAAAAASEKRLQKLKLQSEVSF